MHRTRRRIKNKCENNLKFRSRLLDYSPLSIFFRLIFNSIVALLVVFMVKEALADLDFKRDDSILGYLKAMLSFVVLGELLILTDVALERLLPMPENLRKRIFFQSLASFLLIVAIFILSVNLHNEFAYIPKIASYLGLTIGFAFISSFSNRLLMLRMTDKWVQSQRKIDEMNQEKLQMDYNSLQDQLNPHFLFNNLSVLKSLIMFDKDTALNFTDNFTDVYRYVLKSKDERLVDLEKELEFIKSYLSLHKERLGKGLEIEYKIDKSAFNKKIAPLTLQLLVENAIKHNITSKESPLKIIITVNKDMVMVENLLQLKTSSYSTQTGLDNLTKRYKFLTKREVEIWEDVNKFIVIVPLL